MFDLDQLAEWDRRLAALEGEGPSVPAPAPARMTQPAPAVCPFSGKRREAAA